MKKIYFFLAVAAVFAACSDDDAAKTLAVDLNETEQKLIGKWKLEGVTDTDGTPATIDDCFTGVYTEFTTSKKKVVLLRCNGKDKKEEYDFIFEDGKLKTHYLGANAVKYDHEYEIDFPGSNTLTTTYYYGKDLKEKEVKTYNKL